MSVPRTGGVMREVTKRNGVFVREGKTGGRKEGII
jgi:hypothetical protein